MGFSLLEVAIGIALLGAAIAAGYALLRIDASDQRESNRSKLLYAADHAIISFIAQNGRLPCPDIDGSGNENCSVGNQKGWLPIKTLGLDASAPTRGLLRLRYVAYRSSTSDLAVIRISPLFYPSHWDNYSVPPSGNFFDYMTQPLTAIQASIQSLIESVIPIQTADQLTKQNPPLGVLDFCQGLTLANTASSSTSYAFMRNEYGTAVNIAYGLAEGGADLDGDGNAFDGTLNFDPNTPGLESSTRVKSTSYDDLVLTRTFSAMSKAFSCPQSTRSMDAIAQSLEVVNETQALRDSNYQSSVVLTAIESVKSAVAIYGIKTAATSFRAATEALAAGVAEDVVNIIDCADPITAVLGCPMLAISALGTGLAAAAQIASGVSIVLQVSALGLNVASAAEAGKAAAKAGSAAADSSGSSLDDTKTLLLNAYKDAMTKAANDLGTASSDAATAAASLKTYNDQLASLKNIALPDVVYVSAALQNYIDYKLALKTWYDTSGQATNMRTQATAAASSAIMSSTAAAAAEAINPATAANIVAVTNGISAAATVADTAAKSALASDPSNKDNISNSTSASAAAVAAQIDAYNAASDAAGYVASKQATANSQSLKSIDLANQASTLEASVAADLTAKNKLSATYTAARKMIDSQDNLQVGTEFDSMITAYDDNNSKQLTATQSKTISDSSAQSVINSKAAYDSISSALPFVPGTAAAVTLTTGAYDILRAAAYKGTIK